LAKKKEEEIVQEKTLNEKSKENDQYFEELTNKNSDYMVKLNRHLDESGLDEENKIEAFNEMLPNIIDAQRNHTTARKLYGTVTERADYILANPEGNRPVVYGSSENWKLYLDGALLLGGMFTLITGITYLFGDEVAGMGIVTIVLNYILGGFASLVITKAAPAPGQKGGFLKYILVTTAAMAAWVLLISVATVIIPPQINIFVPGSITLVIGAVSLFLKWYLKRKLNIHGTLL